MSNYKPKYKVDIKLVNKNLLELYKETSRLNKYGRSNYLLLEALNKLNKHDIHNLKKFDNELDKLEQNLDFSNDFSDLEDLLVFANSLNNFMFDKYVTILDKIKDDIR